MLLKQKQPDFPLLLFKIFQRLPIFFQNQTESISQGLDSPTSCTLFPNSPPLWPCPSGTAYVMYVLPMYPLLPLLHSWEFYTNVIVTLQPALAFDNHECKPWSHTMRRKQGLSQEQHTTWEYIWLTLIKLWRQFSKLREYNALLFSNCSQ